MGHPASLKKRMDDAGQWRCNGSLGLPPPRDNKQYVLLRLRSSSRAALSSDLSGSPHRRRPVHTIYTYIPSLRPRPSTPPTRSG